MTDMKQKELTAATTASRKFTPFGNYYRHVILLISMLAFTFVSANTTSFSLTIICMVGSKNNGNGTQGFMKFLGIQI